MKYIFVDTDNGTASPGTAVHTSSTWPSNADRFNSLLNAEADTTVRAEIDDITFLCVGTADDTQATISTSLSAASVTVQGDVSSATWNANKYTIAYSGGNQVALTITKAATTTLKNLQVSYTGTNAAPYAIRFNNGSPANTTENCHIRIGGAGASVGYGIRGQGSGGTFIIKNTTIQVTGTPGGARYGIDRNFNSMSVYNCVVEGFSMTGGIGINGGGTIKNCAVFNNTDDFNGGTVSYCASDDGDGTNAVTGLTWINQFEDYVNGDFRLKVGSSLIGAGIGPSSDANVPTTDIAGSTRSGTTTDIGVILYTAGGGITLTSVSGSSHLERVDIIGTGLSAGQTVTYNGVACTTISASSSLNIRVTFPNFWTNNIKLGNTYELKVRD